MVQIKKPVCRPRVQPVKAIEVKPTWAENRRVSVDSVYTDSESASAAKMQDNKAKLVEAEKVIEKVATVITQPWIKIGSGKNKLTIEHCKQLPEDAFETSDNQYILLATNAKGKVKAQVFETSKPPSGAAMTKSQRKNLARAAARRKAREAKEATETMQEEQKEENENTVAISTTKPKFEVRQATVTVRLCDMTERILEEHIIIYLPPESVGMLALSCHMLKQRVDTGYVWKTLFEQHCPTSRLSASSMEDWKHCYLLEVNAIAADLRCFHSKATFDEAVLGVPLEYTTNPKTRRVDYISSSMDVLSLEAYKRDKVRKTVWGDEFTDFLPLYITDEHFGRALPTIRASICKLAPDWKTGGRFEPEMALDVLPKIMTTLIVQIADAGVHASERVLDGYCQVHRLLLALIEEYRLEAVVERRLRDFITRPSARSKEACPGLGVMAALISVCDSVSWVDFVRAYLEESFDRAVLWACKAYPALASTGEARADHIEQTPSGPVDMERIEQTFDASKVALRLTMFHAFFVNRVARPQGMSLYAAADIADNFYGKPHNKIRQAFSAAVKNILQVDSWPGFFGAVSLQVPTKSHLTSWLVQSVKNSAKKRYHTEGMDFSRIHQSGVSRLLLKGESYSAGHGLRHVKLEEGWGYGPGNRYLDASCLLFNAGGEHVGTVDYHHQTFTGTHKAIAVRHSGDVMDHEKSEGRHTLNIDLHALPSSVTALYFTISAWTGNLSSFRHPCVTFCDAKSNTELCRYNLEASCSNETRTAILMCKLVRSGAAKSATEWSVTALGTVCMGKADAYAPMLDAIQLDLVKSAK